MNIKTFSSVQPDIFYALYTNLSLKSHSRCRNIIYILFDYILFLIIIQT